MGDYAPTLSGFTHEASGGSNQNEWLTPPRISRSWRFRPRPMRAGCAPVADGDRAFQRERPGARMVRASLVKPAIRPVSRSLADERRATPQLHRPHFCAYGHADIPTGGVPARHGAAVHGGPGAVLSAGWDAGQLRGRAVGADCVRRNECGSHRQQRNQRAPDAAGGDSERLARAGGATGHELAARSAGRC